jgi:hypothetical protein
MEEQDWKRPDPPDLEAYDAVDRDELRPNPSRPVQYTPDLVDGIDPHNPDTWPYPLWRYDNEWRCRLKVPPPTSEADGVWSAYVEWAATLDDTERQPIRQRRDHG